MNTNSTSNGFRVITTKVHGVIDYLSGIALLLAPNIFGFADVGGPAVLIPRGLGIAILAMAVLTRYEFGVLKLIPMSAHLVIDLVASVFLAASPFVFNFADNPANVWLPHVVVGITYLVITVLTQTESHFERTPIRTGY